jgi:hypothetical protein
VVELAHHQQHTHRPGAAVLPLHVEALGDVGKAASSCCVSPLTPVLKRNTARMKKRPLNSSSNCAISLM